ncbi:MAG: T9SS type A sorting domain-containing protein, partial [Candidatus Aphodosoma sp.]
APFTKVSDYVCEGKEYYGYGFTLNDIVSDTVVTRTVKTIEGCDSIVELTLDFIPTVRVAITETINEGETYEFGGNSLSQAGEYEYTFHTALFCDSVVTLTLNVTTPVDNAYALPIVVAPNPVYGGQSTFVNREWTAAEQTGMRVEVLNSVGQVVEVFTPTSFPIEVEGIYVSGVYYIRVTTGTGDIYLGRLVVR